jgi:succinoglycan biosynthesis transport protein ExoP
MLPGKVYAPEDFVLILRRRYWLLLVPFAIIAATTAALARKLPDLYRADTLILVIPQKVPESYVKSTVTTKIEDRLQAISNQILSRTRLERIIQDLNLYADERRNGGIMEDIIQHMRDDISVKVERGDAFRVGYIGRQPRTVMQVTDRLAGLFIEESLRDREVLAEGTSQFLESQLEASRQQLIDSEKKLETYKKQFSGQLPSQVESNLQAIQNNQLHIQAVLDGLHRARDERLSVERQLTELEAAAGPGGDSPDTSVAISPTIQQLDAARADLLRMQQRLKPEHPDIAIQQRRVHDLENQAEQEALQTPLSTSAPARPTSAQAAQAARQRKIAELHARMEDLDKEISDKSAQEKQLRVIVAAYQARVDAVPTRESEMIELTRDYTTLQANYGNLLAKREDSKIAANLERRQIGEQFKLLDPARMPERPFSPDRRAINWMGLLGGLGVGLGLIALLEYRDASFKTDEDVTRVLTLPVLAVVPLMQSEQEKKAAFRRHLLLGIGMGGTVAACLALVVWTFVK